MSHFVGGAALTGALAAVADHYLYENRAMIGFGVSTAGIVLGETIQFLAGGGRFSSFFLDVASHTLGSALGAVITDRFILTPVVTHDQASNPYYGLESTFHF